MSPTWPSLQGSNGEVGYWVAIVITPLKPSSRKVSAHFTPAGPVHEFTYCSWTMKIKTNVILSSAKNGPGNYFHAECSSHVTTYF